MESKIQFDGYYLTTDQNVDGLCFVLEGPWRPEYESVILEKNVKGLRILSYDASSTKIDISFVSDLTTLRAIQISSFRVKDISPLANLTALNVLTIDCDLRKTLDFSVFNDLRFLSITWRGNLDSIFAVSSLETLNISNYPYENMTRFETLRNLTSLRLSSRKLSTLAGSSALRSLSSIELDYCSRLESLTGIEQYTQLVRIDFETCKRIRNLDPIGKLKNLEILWLTNCDGIDSLTPLINCQNLKDVSFVDDTLIVDGDLSIYEGLPHLTRMLFGDRKHYSHTRDYIQSVLENRFKVAH